MIERPIIRARPLRSTAVALLQAQGLPVSDITAEHLEHFFFVGLDDSPTGLVGVEIYGTNALLRSLVVAESARTQGVGSALVQYAESYAASHSVGASRQRQRPSSSAAAIGASIESKRPPQSN
jgi:GNAT superfamily N-acetyltransferase